MKIDNKKSKKGTRRIEAWIYTVINPLIEALRIEKSFLRDKNWTWRYFTKNWNLYFHLKDTWIQPIFQFSGIFLILIAR